LPEHRDLQNISIYIYPSFDSSADDSVDPKMAVGEEVYKQWMDLDDLLVQLWESHAVPTKLIAERKAGWVYRVVTGLLPEITKRGIIQPVTYAGV
jgi:hypothetical protein